MKRLRHPVRAIREPFGTAGLVVACVALVLALTGAAFAATGLNGKQKKEVEKIAKKFAGKPGAPGAAGPAGPAGPKGDTGAAGSNGTNGTNGSPGATGKSVVATNEPKGTNCEAGGSKFEVEGSSVKHYACIGEDGEPGEKGEKGDEGSPWTAGGTLPPGATETGTWAFSRSVETITTEVEGEKKEIKVGDSEEILVPISFPIRLPTQGGNLLPEKVHYSTEEDFETFCQGTSALPKPVNSLELCIYENTGEPVKGTHYVETYKPNQPMFEFENGEERFLEGEGNGGASLTGAILGFAKPEGSDHGGEPPVHWDSAHGSGSFAIKG